MLSGSYSGGNTTVEVYMTGLTNAELRAVPVDVAGPVTDEQLRANPVPVSGTVAVSNLPATQPVSGTVAVSNLPATQPVSGTVSVSNLPATQPVSGTVAVSGSVAVTGPLTDAALRASAVPVSLASMPTTPVTGTFWQTTQPVSGPLTDAQLRAQAVPVSGTFWQATQPISGTVTANAGSGTMAVSGPLTDAQLRASAVPVSGTFFQATQPVSLAALPALADKAAASNSVIGSVTLGNSQGKTATMKTGSLVTTATTADQVILTYTVTAGKTLYLQYLIMQCRLTTFASTATNFGTISLESPAGTKLVTKQVIGPGYYDSPALEFAEPIAIAAGTVIRVVCTPAATTSFTWTANFGGYER